MSGARGIGYGENVLTQAIDGVRRRIGGLGALAVAPNVHCNHAEATGKAFGPAGFAPRLAVLPSAMEEQERAPAAGDVVGDACTVTRSRELSIHGRTRGKQGEHGAEEPRGGGSLTQFRTAPAQAARRPGKTARHFESRLDVGFFRRFRPPERKRTCCTHSERRA